MKEVRVVELAAREYRNMEKEGNEFLEDKEGGRVLELTWKLRVEGTWDGTSGKGGGLLCHGKTQRKEEGRESPLPGHNQFDGQQILIIDRSFCLQGALIRQLTCTNQGFLLDY